MNNENEIRQSTPEEQEQFNWLKRVIQLRSQKSLENVDYYTVSLFIDNNGEVSNSYQTEWIGDTKTKPRRELRQASKVKPEIARQLLKDIGEPAMILNSITDLIFFFGFGGHGIIEESLVEIYFPDMLKPREMFKHSTGSGFTSVLIQSQKRHAPSKKLRMKVLKRDGRRCAICGRSPFDYVDVELHVHHIIPWGQGGITEEDNLLTLCKTCHDGLDPHYDASLKEYVPHSPSAKISYIVYLEKIRDYQSALNKLLGNTS